MGGAAQQTAEQFMDEDDVAHELGKALGTHACFRSRGDQPALAIVPGAKEPAKRHCLLILQKDTQKDTAKRHNEKTRQKKTLPNDIARTRGGGTN